MEKVGQKIQVRGIVQGVGFRPFIYAQAAQNHLTGWVRNTSSGVEIEINGSPDGVSAFLSALRDNPPPLARIDSLETFPTSPDSYTSFEIIASQPQEGDFLPISPDVAICPDCQRELFDPRDRRYRYPFINCTNCGPRFTIIQDIPYDRPKTTMSAFPMCPDCLEEYQNPLNRRFHAQPVACPECGPQIWFEAGGERLGEREEALQIARHLLQGGKIIAVKGLGGFHLACDATNPAAVAELRRRKQRSEKAFALMAFDLPAVQRHCVVSEEEQELLLSHQAPIVLLERKPTSNIAPEAAVRQHTLGFMLPYTPLHLLLLEPAPGFPEVLVMTSGNISEEPIAYRDDDSRQQLTGLADGFLLHDRPIHMRVDDSVARVIDGEPYPVRRSRGYAPDPIRLPEEIPSILAAGAELKNTFCLTRGNYAFLSHHIGDLENYETLRSFEEGIAHFQKLFRIRPEIIACDLHPDYLASRYAHQLAGQTGLPLVEVQHHHAHLAACLAEHGFKRDETAVGLCFDGTGLGTDGAVWGGEVLFGGYASYQRFYHLKYVPLPGGDLAVRKPARMALSHLWAAGLEWEPELPAVQALCGDEQTVIKTQLTRQINAPLTSSMGRLFDAAAALIGVRPSITYEGQAAIEMEAMADPAETGYYEFSIQGEVIDPAPVFSALISDWFKGVSPAILSARFHNSVAGLCVRLCRSIRINTGIQTVALSGGVWQNRLLLEQVIRRLEDKDFTVLVHRQVPTNDGGIALGQAVIAAAQRS